MKELGLYTIVISDIEKRVADAGMTNFFAQEVTRADTATPALASV